MSSAAAIATISPVLAAVIVAVGVVMWFALRPRWDFTIVVQNGDVRLQGKLPAIQRAAIADFFGGEASSAGNVRIRGRRPPRGPLVLQIDGDLPAGDRQRIRNFLVMHT